MSNTPDSFPRQWPYFMCLAWASPLTVRHEEVGLERLQIAAKGIRTGLEVWMSATKRFQVGLASCSSSSSRAKSVQNRGLGLEPFPNITKHDFIRRCNAAELSAFARHVNKRHRLHHLHARELPRVPLPTPSQTRQIPPGNVEECRNLHRDMTGDVRLCQRRLRALRTTGRTRLSLVVLVCPHLPPPLHPIPSL